MILPSPQGNITYIQTGGALIYVIGRLQSLMYSYLTDLPEGRFKTSSLMSFVTTFPNLRVRHKQQGLEKNGKKKKQRGQLVC